MPEENLTNNSNPPNPQAQAPAQAEAAPIEETAPEPIEQPAPPVKEAEIDIEPEQSQQEEKQPKDQQIAEEAPKLEEIGEIGESNESKAQEPPAAEPQESTKPEQTEKSESIKAPAISQQDLDRLSEQIIPSAQDIKITEEQKKSFWQKVMQRLSQLSRKKRHNRWHIQKQAILKLLSQKGRIKNDDVEQAMEVSHTTAVRYLNKLIKEELIERLNAKKKTFYLLTPKGQTARE